MYAKSMPNNRILAWRPLSSHNCTIRIPVVDPSPFGADPHTADQALPHQPRRHLTISPLPKSHHTPSMSTRSPVQAGSMCRFRPPIHLSRPSPHHVRCISYARLPVTYVNVSCTRTRPGGRAELGEVCRCCFSNTHA